MNEAPLRTVIAGFGAVAQADADDAGIRRTFRYATHAQVLRDHPGFDWIGVIDPAPAARAAAVERWGIPDVVADAASFPDPERVELLVIATKPGGRDALLPVFPNLRAVLVEKPLGADLADAAAFVEQARAQSVLVQVNVPRRADPLTRSLASGALAGYIGPVQAASAVYGNGLVNNGTHLVDLVRMLLGEIAAVQAYPQTRFVEGPLDGDVNVPFVLEPAGGVPVLCTPVRFNHFREVALDLWGERARLVYAHGGLEVRIHRIVPGKAPTDSFELEIVASETLGSTLGESFYAIYDNLAATLAGRSTLVSSAESALRTAAIIEAIRASCARDGARIATP